MELDKYLVVETRGGWKKYVHLYDSPEDCSAHPFEIAPGMYANSGSSKDPDFSGLTFKDKTGKAYAILRHGLHRNVYDSLFCDELVKEDDSRFIDIANNAGISYNKTFKGCTVNASSIAKLNFKDAGSANSLFRNAVLIGEPDEELSLYFENLRPHNCVNMFRNTTLKNGLKIHLHGISPSMYQILGITDTKSYILEGMVNWENLALTLDPELKTIDRAFTNKYGAWPTTMKNAFENMKNLKTIEDWLIDGFYVTDASYAFHGCESLGHINVGFLSGDSLSNLTGLFSGCSSLTSINGLEKITITNDVSIMGLFQGAEKLPEVTGLQNWNTTHIKNMANIFRDCGSLTRADIENWNTDSVLDASGMFQGCLNWTKELKFNSPVFKNVVNINHMFSRVSPALIKFAYELGQNREDAMSAAEDLDYLFEYTEASEGIDLSTWHINETKPVHCQGAFNGVKAPIINLWANSEAATNCDYTNAFMNSNVKHINGVIPLNNTIGAVFTNCPDVRSVLFAGTEADALLGKGTLLDEQYICNEENYGGAKIVSISTTYDEKLETYETKYTIQSALDNIGTQYLHINLPDGGLVSCFSFRNKQYITEELLELHNIAITNERAGVVELTLKEGASFQLYVTTEELAPDTPDKKTWPTLEWSKKKKA